MLASALTFASAVLGATPLGPPSGPDIPPECGTRADFDRSLHQRLGDSADPSSVRVSIARAGSRFRLRVQLDDEVRELDDANCSALFRAAVVVAISMLMHEPETPAKASTPAEPAPKPTPPAKAREYPRFSVDGGAGVNVGTLPHPVLALGLESKALWRYVGVSVDVRYLFPASKLDEQRKGVELQALGAGVTGIFRPSRGWEARLGFAAQRVWGQGRGPIAQPYTAHVWAAGPTLGLGYTPLLRPPFWAGLTAEGQLNALRGNFQILHYSQSVTDTPREIYPMPWLAVSSFVRLGLVW